MLSELISLENHKDAREGEREANLKTLIPVPLGAGSLDIAVCVLGRWLPTWVLACSTALGRVYTRKACFLTCSLHERYTCGA